MTDVRSAEIMLDPHPSSVGRARRWLSRELEEWGLEDFDYDASVVLSELVTNAVLHARSEIELRLVYDDVLRLEVCDASDTMPVPRGHASSTTTGRGLHLVAALASSWGYEPRGAGKCVWAEFAEVAGSPRSRSTGPGATEHTATIVGMQPQHASPSHPTLQCRRRTA
jgi:anti-sigma regulatory factor (Ser/Thr protein kinase)